MVTELCDVSPCCSDRELVEPQSFSFFKKRAHCCTDTQEDVKYEGSPVIAPPLSRRRMTPPTPVQNSYTYFVRDHGRYEKEGRVLNARERTERKNNHREEPQCEGASIGSPVGSRGC